ncbi:hypothetical protein ACFL96_05110 [Thermoproteota archaeon]
MDAQLERVVLEENISIRDGEKIAARTRRMYLLLDKAERSAEEGSYNQAVERYSRASEIADELGMQSIITRINSELQRNRGLLEYSHTQ